MLLLVLLQCNGAVVLEILVSVASVTVIPVESSSLGGGDNSTCGVGYYVSRSLHQSITCLPCTTCGVGEGQFQPCTNTSDTVCRQCWPLGMFSTPLSAPSSPGSRECRNCTSCEEVGREQVTACSKNHDAVCGACLAGFFLGVSRDSTTVCLRCSRCPPDDQRVVRWRECGETGLDRNMWCAPGAYAEPETTTELLEAGTTPPTSTHLYPVLGTEAFLAVHNGDSAGATDLSASSILVIVSAFFCVMVTGVLFILMAELLRRRHCHRDRSYSNIAVCNSI